MKIKPLFNDDELLARMAKGEERAFRLIYQQYYQTVYRFAFLYLRCPADAEEVVQETFLKLWMNGEHAHEIGQLTKYLRTIAANRSLDLLRMQARRIKVSELKEKHEAVYHHNPTEEAVLFEETKKLLDDAVAKLPRQQRLVYELCNVEGLKNDEIAEQLNLSPLTVRTHLKLALKSIREQMRQHPEIAVAFFLLKIF